MLWESVGKDLVTTCKVCVYKLASSSGSIHQFRGENGDLECEEEWEM